ncbi:TPA: hypothetical protein OTR37_003452, partial [Aeromonas dhakensis]|nr:hypothetical protein [Aeromonas dhakensis]
MRLLLPLLLLPSLSYATCHPGVNYGQYPLAASNPVCVPYTGSSLGGCFAICGGATGASVCVEFPNASPPSKGPYISSGNECEYKDGSDSGSHGNSGGNPSGSDGTNESPTGLVDVGQILVGDKLTTDLGVGFNSVANNVNKSAAKIESAVKDFAKQLDSARFLDNKDYMDVMKSDLARVAQNTSGISAGANSNSELVGYLKSINDKTVLDPSMWNNQHAELMKMLWEMRQQISYIGVFPNQQELININQNTNSMKGTLWNISDEVQRQGYDIADMLKELKKI